MQYEFIGLGDRAKEAGISEASLKAQVLEGREPAYIFLPGTSVEGSQQHFLPPHDHEQFPQVRWTDRGSIWKKDGRYYERVQAGGRYLDGAEAGCSVPTYAITGWGVLDPSSVQQVLTKARALNTAQHWVWIFCFKAGSYEVESEIPLRVLGEQVWVPDGDGGYHEIQGPMITPHDLYFLSSIRPGEAKSTQLNPKREKSLLRVVRALDVMSKLPDRGAAGAVLQQLQELGFSGPDDDTVRAILKDARALTPD